MKPFFAANVWGKSYIDNFCNFTLPMQFSSGNLPKIAKEAEVRYVIFTSHEDTDYFSKQKIIIELNKVIEVQIIGLHISKKDKYFLISELQNKGMNLAKQEGYDCFFPLYADVLCSDGTLYNAYCKIKKGYGAVVSLGPQTILANMENAIIKSKKYNENKHAIKISSRDLVKLTFENLHPFHAPSFWEKGAFTTTPSMLFFRGKNNSVLAHGFHLHPVAFKLPDDPTLYKPFHGTLDENYMSVMFDSSDNVYISQDSDEVFMCSLEALEGGDARAASTDGDPNIAKVARFAERHTFLLQREFIRVPIRLHSTETIKSDWFEVEKEANLVVERILTRLATPDSVLQLEDPLAFASRMYHLDQVKLIERARLSTAAKSNDSYIVQEVKQKSSQVSQKFWQINNTNRNALYNTSSRIKEYILVKSSLPFNIGFGYSKILLHLTLRALNGLINLGKLKRVYFLFIKIYYFIFSKKGKMYSINKKSLIAYIKNNFCDKELRKFPTLSLVKYTLKCLILAKKP